MVLTRAQTKALVKNITIEQRLEKLEAHNKELLLYNDELEYRIHKAFVMVENKLAHLERVIIHK